MTGRSATDPADAMPAELANLASALGDLSNGRDPNLAIALTKVFAAIAHEASKGPRFANALSKALRDVDGKPSPTDRPRRSNRRNPSIVDIFQIYADGGEAGLRARLGELDLEQLRDIIAEHGMDNDRLAMKWKDHGRVVDRIVDRVVTRAAKGSAFR